MWLNDWKYRIPFTVPASKIGETLTHFPAYLKISESSGLNSADLTKVFDELQENKLKFALTKADGITQLFAEIERWNAENRIADIHYSRSGFSLNPLVNNKLFLYFDPNKPDNTDFVGVTGSVPAQNVWAPEHKAVYHFNDNPDTSHIKDSTSNGNDGTKKGANEPQEVNGKIGKAQDFDGANDYINCGTDASIMFTTPFSLEAYINSTSIVGTGDILEKLGAFKGYMLQRYNDEILFKIGNGTAYQQLLTTDFNLLANTPYHIVAVWDGTTLRVYKNGVASSVTTAVAAVGSSTINLIIGSDHYGGTTDPFEGYIDEPEISGIARSAAWVGASYETQRDQFHLFDPVESKPFHVPFILKINRAPELNLLGRAKA